MKKMDLFGEHMLLLYWNIIETLITANVTPNKAPPPTETETTTTEVQTTQTDGDDEMEINESKMTTQSDVNDKWDTNFSASQEDFDAIMLGVDSKKRLADADAANTSATKKKKAPATSSNRRRSWWGQRVSLQIGNYWSCSIRVEAIVLLYIYWG